MPPSPNAAEGRESESAGFTDYRTPTHDEIARRAYQIWEDAGRPEGRELEHWLAAEHALLFPTTVREEVEPSVPPAPPPAPVGGTKPTSPRGRRGTVMRRSAAAPASRSLRTST